MLVGVAERGGLVRQRFPTSFRDGVGFSVLLRGPRGDPVFTSLCIGCRSASAIPAEPTVPSWPYIGNVLYHAVLPAATLIITSIGGWVLTMRNNMVSALSEDYIRMARAKGLSPARTMLDYAGRNAVLPNLTGFGMSLGFVCQRRSSSSTSFPTRELATCCCRRCSTRTTRLCKLCSFSSR